MTNNFSRAVFCTLCVVSCLIMIVLPKKPYLEMHSPSSYQLMIEIKDGYQVIIKGACVGCQTFVIGINIVVLLMYDIR